MSSRAAVPGAWVGYALVAAAATCWGAQSVVAKLLLTRGAGGLDPASLVSARTALSALIMTVALGVINRALLRVRAGDVGRLALLGIIGMAISNYFYYVALQRIPVATAALLIYTAPLLVLAADVLLSRTARPPPGPGGRDRDAGRRGAGRPRLRAVSPRRQPGRDHRRHPHRGRLRLLQPVGQADRAAAVPVDDRDLHAGRRRGLLAAAGAAVDRPAGPHPPATWAGLGVVVAFGTLAPASLYLAGLARISAAHASVTSTLEPAVAAAAAFLVLGERLEWPQLAGGVLILAGIASLHAR